MQQQMIRIKEIIATTGGRVFMVLWLLALLLFAGLIVVSSFQGEFAGGFVFALLPTAILIDTSIVISLFLVNQSRMIARVSWVFLNVAAIIAILAGVDPHHPDAARDAELILNYTMFILSFPLGAVGPLLVWICGSALSWLFGRAELLPSGLAKFYVSNLTVWFSFFLVGYLQWFVLFPHVINKRRGKPKTDGLGISGQESQNR